jgi:predicted alpha/beta superfamily hydrolase
MRKVIFILLIACFGYSDSFAQFPKVDIPGSQLRKLNSAIVNQEYELHISLPNNYNNSDKKYPVVYLMDSQWDFPLVKSIYGQQYYDGFIPELIIVGITWGGKDPKPDSLRVRDYTPTHELPLKQSGGADNFLSFMKTELFPFIEENYKADKENRVMMGCSFGGLITLYAMLTHTEMFSGYIAATPAIEWNKAVLFEYEKKFAAKQNANPVRVYTTVGDVEFSRAPFERFAAQMISRNYPTVNISSKVLENTGHSGTKSETYTRGLQYIFERPKLKTGDALLNRYSGTYASAGTKLELKAEDGTLVLYTPGGRKYSLYAASETAFYSTAQFLNIYFETDAGKVKGFELKRYGSREFLRKLN